MLNLCSIMQIVLLTSGAINRTFTTYSVSVSFTRVSSSSLLWSLERLVRRLGEIETAKNHLGCLPIHFMSLITFSDPYYFNISAVCVKC